MMLRVPHRHYRLIHAASRLSFHLPSLPRFRLMGSKCVFRPSPAILQCVSLSSTSGRPTVLFRPSRLLYSPNHWETSRNSAFLVYSSNGSFSSMARVPRPVTIEGPEESTLSSARLNILIKKLAELDIDGHECSPGQYNHLLCPSCGGGDSEEKTLSLFITQDGNSAFWICFRGKCGWKGNINAIADFKQSSKVTNKAKKREITEKMLGLEPLCNELLAYFADRMISGETLRRNGVLQKRSGDDEFFIAFTYRKKGNLVSCKYRDINKRFWQEQNTEKIFYGVDDITNARDVIIVEGEIDKLSMEEAGFLNCVSVPDGAPSQVSTKDVPAPDKV